MVERVCEWLTILDPNWKLEMVHYYSIRNCHCCSHGCRLSELGGDLVDNLALECKKNGGLGWGLVRPRGATEAECRAQTISGLRDGPEKGEGNLRVTGEVSWDESHWLGDSHTQETPSQSLLSPSFSV